jgi:hypothetical protein
MKCLIILAFITSDISVLVWLALVVGSLVVAGIKKERVI